LIKILLKRRILLEKQTMNLTRFLIEEQRKYPHASGVFTELFSEIALAAKIISREVNKAGLVDILGYTGSKNVTGDEVKKLDLFANNTMKHILCRGGNVIGLASEEEEEAVQCERGKYLVVFDPLDGSSNIDVNVSIGTIFGIYNKMDDFVDEKQFMRPGRELVAAGYIIYGSSTMFVYSTGNGVHGFTLDPSVGEFILSHKDIKIPKKGKIFSINTGNYKKWDEKLKNYIDFITTPDKKTQRPYSLRYIGSLVADFHRNLLYGGIFLYPKDMAHPNGKLRLLYEAQPLAFIVEQAGGYASDGYTPILDKVPHDIHERTPLFIGSIENVKELEQFLQK